MDAGEALKTIRGLAGAGRITITAHAYERMGERGATYDDVRHALVNAGACVWQAPKRTWRVDSEDLDGDELTLAVAIDDGVIVVTLF